MASWQAFGKEAFIPFLGPHCRQTWNEIEKTWAGKTSLMEVLRDEGKKRVAALQGPPSRRTMILNVSVVNVRDVSHAPVVSEGHGKDVLSTVLEGFIFPTPIETI